MKNRDIEKTGMVNAIFVSDLNTDYGLWVFHCPGLEEFDCEYDKLPANSKFVWDLLLHLDPSRIHLRTLKK